MTVVGPLLLPYDLEYSSDTNVPESQGHQGPFSSCQGQMQSLIKLLIATICRYRQPPRKPCNSPTIKHIILIYWRQIFHFAFSISNPLRLNQPLALLVQVFVGSADSTITDTSNLGNFFRGLWLAKEV
jgi:hypothetical protein